MNVLQVELATCRAAWHGLLDHVKDYDKTAAQAQWIDAHTRALTDAEAKLHEVKKAWGLD